MPRPIDMMHNVKSALDGLHVPELTGAVSDESRAIRDAAAHALETARDLVSDFLASETDGTVRSLLTSQDADTLYRCLNNELRVDVIALNAYKAATAILESRDASEVHVPDAPTAPSEVSA